MPENSFLEEFMVAIALNSANHKNSTKCYIVLFFNKEKAQQAVGWVVLCCTS
jgi:hypothetical protein